MTKKQMRIQKERLLGARSQLVLKIRKNRCNLLDSTDRPVQDSGDRIIEYTRKNYLQGESGLLCLNLRMIEKALERIKLGTYGQCSECGKSIGKKRLSAVPWALLCFNCQERKEMSDLSRRQVEAIRRSKKNRLSSVRRVISDSQVGAGLIPMESWSDRPRAGPNAAT